MYGLVFVEAYFFYESPDTCVHWCDMLLHSGIIGIFAFAEMHETVYHEPCSGNEDDEHADVVYGTEYFLLFHFLSIVVYGIN